MHVITLNNRFTQSILPGWPVGDEGNDQCKNEGRDNVPVGDVDLARFPFSNAGLNLSGELQLWMRYDDGFIAYLNGVEVARRLAPASAAFNSPATGSRTNSEVVKPEVVSKPSIAGLLKDGDNVLAIHGMNTTAAETNMFQMTNTIWLKCDRCWSPE